MARPVLVDQPIPGERRLIRPLTQLEAVPGGSRRRPDGPIDPGQVQGLRVGLLGGSFNPAHGGHRRISLDALRLLGLDQIWWLVSPQNPLKSRRETAPLARRVAYARRVADHPRILVTDLERQLATQYSVDSVARIMVRHPTHRFVWLMGADNLAGLHRWRRWYDLAKALPVAVFDREPYAYGALRSVAGHRFATAFWSSHRLTDLVDAPPPAWTFIRLRTHPAASSKIRAGGGWRITPAKAEMGTSDVASTPA